MNRERRGVGKEEGDRKLSVAPSAYYSRLSPTP